LYAKLNTKKTMENTNIPIAPEQSIRKIGNKQYALVVIGGLILFATGLILYSFGFFEKDKPTQTKDSLSELTPPVSKKTTLEDDKYKHQTDDLRSYGGGTEELTTITGKEPTYPKESNEQLSEDDYKAVENARKSVHYNTQMPKTETQKKKEKIRQDFQEKQAQELKNQQYFANDAAPIFNKTQEELEDERLEKEQKELNNKTAAMILSNVEKLNANKEQPTSNNSQIQSKEKQTNLNPIKIKENQAHSETSLHPETSINTMGMNWKKGGFYGFSQGNNQKYFTDNDAISAVIHGQGEAINVQDGSIIKLRLLQNTILQVNEQAITLPMGTLLAGTCRISDERVQIIVSAIRLANSIYPISIAVFDLDGQQGLYVPQLKEKNVLSRELTDAATRPFNGTSVFIPDGSIQKQVGSQIALQSTQGLMQGAKGYLRSKIQSPKVTIKPNYKVLLKSVNLTQFIPPSNEE
jgi:conjugative transposon TraM protein